MSEISLRTFKMTLMKHLEAAPNFKKILDVKVMKWVGHHMIWIEVLRKLDH